MAQPTDRRYTKEHEWVKVDGATALVGITDHAQSALGDIVYVELPKPGATLAAGKPMGVVESVKAVSDIFAPVSGTVAEVNAAVADDPARVNADAFGEGWLVKVTMADPAQAGSLLDATAYEALVEAESH